MVIKAWNRLRIIINKFKTKMKFVAVAALIATTQAQTVCTDDDFGDVCPEGGCCGYLQPAAGEAARACSDGDQSSADGYDGEDVFTCDAPVVEEEGASKVVLGASALLAALYMA